LRQREAALEGLGVAVLVVTFEAGFLARAYVENTRLAWPLVMDESRALYAAYGMLRGRAWDIWGPATWLAYARSLARGGALRRATGDVSQLGGDVLIDPDGIVRVHHVGSGPADRPSVQSLLAVVRASGRGR
jgi:alkyl hydroperoxide reductase subunit AhpC